MRHLIGAASAWRQSVKERLLAQYHPSKNDRKVNYKLKVPGDVPVDAFWSIIVHKADRHVQKNELNPYSLNNLSAKKHADGSVTVQFAAATAVSRIAYLLWTAETTW